VTKCQRCGAEALVAIDGEPLLCPGCIREAQAAKETDDPRWVKRARDERRRMREDDRRSRPA
jgi:uncharacterized Zn finger protein (UPF0148 family)